MNGTSPEIPYTVEADRLALARHRWNGHAALLAAAPDPDGRMACPQAAVDVSLCLLVESCGGGEIMDATLKETLRQRAEEDDRFYDAYAESLEPTHRGQYVAIGRTGELVVGPDDIDVLDQALAKFGRGNFAFRRIGERILGRWR